MTIVCRLMSHRSRIRWNFAVVVRRAFSHVVFVGLKDPRSIIRDLKKHRCQQHRKPQRTKKAEFSQLQ